MKKFGIKEIVTIGIGTVLFVVLTDVSIPIMDIPNINICLEPRRAVLAILAAVFGPIVGGVIGLLGYLVGSKWIYGDIWWSYVIPEAIVGVSIGLFARKFAVQEGGFNKSNCILFNVVQVIGNAIAWIGLGPVLDIVFYEETADKVFIQGVGTFLGNILVIGILGTILLAVYSNISGKSSSCKKED
ncbi:MAG: ECF-type riboflavin transporter substrate-binding protein [Lachnospiraceae bacterium]|nr:ECF-type riboflavin transporter substrate-binding protein [Lachnospiraceae bacterium]